eukprot:3746110-Amphidinium_carterae.1
MALVEQTIPQKCTASVLVPAMLNYWPATQFKKSATIKKMMKSFGREIAASARRRTGSEVVNLRMGGAQLSWGGVVSSLFQRHNELFHHIRTAVNGCGGCVFLFCAVAFRVWAETSPVQRESFVES